MINMNLKLCPMVTWVGQETGLGNCTLCPGLGHSGAAPSGTLQQFLWFLPVGKGSALSQVSLESSRMLEGLTHTNGAGGTCSREQCDWWRGLWRYPIGSGICDPGKGILQRDLQCSGEDILEGRWWRILYAKSTGLIEAARKTVSCEILWRWE